MGTAGPALLLTANVASAAVTGFKIGTQIGEKNCR